MSVQPIEAAHTPMASAMSQTLIQAGYDLLRSTDASDALRQAKAMRPDIVLLDALIPRIGGLAVWRGS